MQSFAIKPFFNLDSDTYPTEVRVELPRGCDLTVDQVYNFVFFHITFKVGTEVDLVSRRVLLITQGESVPADYELIGSIIGNERNPGADQGEEGVEEFPIDEDTFYNSLVMLNVYIEPERTAKIENANRWSFGDKR